MAHSVKRHLHVDADAYDVEIRRFIPHYDDMLATGVELLAALAPPNAHVLDLGGGTGALSAAVLGGLPEARVTVLDVDSAMLGEAPRPRSTARSTRRCPRVACSSTSTRRSRRARGSGQ